MRYNVDGIAVPILRQVEILVLVFDPLRLDLTWIALVFAVHLQLFNFCLFACLFY